MEGIPLFLAGKAPTCEVGSTKTPLSGDVLQRYTDMKQALLSSGSLTGQQCAAFFNANAIPIFYFNNLSDAVTR